MGIGKGFHPVHIFIQVPIPSEGAWGGERGEIENDLEGMETGHGRGGNVAFLFKIHIGTSLYPPTARGTGSIPGRGTKIPQAEWCSQKIKK